MSICSYKHSPITYDCENCPLCLAWEDNERLKRELSRKQYFNIMLGLDKEAYDRLIHLSKLSGPSEVLNELLEKAVRLGIENLIIQIEEQDK